MALPSLMVETWDIVHGHLTLAPANAINMSFFVCRQLPVQNCISWPTPLKSAGLITPYQLLIPMCHSRDL